METAKTAKPDAIETLVRQVKDLFPQGAAEVYHLPTHPYKGEYEEDVVHLAVIADVEDEELNEARTPLSKQVEEANISLNFEPLVVFHTGQPGRPLAGIARKEGIRL
jgi:hypothetical protein